MNNNSLQRHSLCFAGLGLSLILTACGGGGGGGDAASSTTASPPVLTLAPALPAVETPPAAAALTPPAPGPVPQGALLINEVSSNYFDDTGAWIEIYNSSDKDISLEGVSLRSMNVVSELPEIFALPVNSVIKAKGYLIVAGTSGHIVQNTDQIVYLGSQKSSGPAWNETGAVELIQNGATLDFVRFGGSKQEPLTPSAWDGSDVFNRPDWQLLYGKSMVRSINKPNTHSQRDWKMVDFATPGGPNDVSVGAVDSDNDGIPDSAEVSGGTFAGIDYYSMGARVGTPDIFIQMDHMKSDDKGILPAKEAMQKVVDAFKLKNIAVHFDTGGLYKREFSPKDFNLGGGRGSSNNEVAFNKCTSLDDVSDCGSVYAYKDKNMDIRRKLVFHYLLMANSQKPDGSYGSSGRAEIFGNDLIVTLGEWGLNTKTTNAAYQLVNFQASTIMHELGHNLGLQHGGDEENNNKPNYYSTMNYLYQLMGLGTDAKSIAPVERYYLDRHMPGYEWSNQCKLEGSPCGPDFRISYSDGSGANLNENSLLESELIGRGSNKPALYADWNLDGFLNNYRFAMNLDSEATKDILHDYNDWDNLYLNFSRFPDGNSGASKKRSLAVTNNPILNDRQRWAEETAPSAAFFAAVRNVR